MVGSGQTQLCHWNRCSECWYYHDFFPPKGWASEEEINHIGEPIQKILIEHLHMLGNLPSPSETDGQPSHKHK